MSAEEKNKLARRAVLHVLMRVKQNPEIAHFLGAGSESFDLLTATAAALSDSPLREVRNNVSPGSADLPHYTAEEYLAEL